MVTFSDFAVFSMVQLELHQTSGFASFSVCELCKHLANLHSSALDSERSQEIVYEKRE